MYQTVYSRLLVVGILFIFGFWGCKKEAPTSTGSAAPGAVSGAVTSAPGAAEVKKKKEPIVHEVVINAVPVDPYASKRPSPFLKIINGHEHVESRKELPKFFKAMDATGIEKSVILASPMYTYRLGSAGFTDYKENNEEVVAMGKMHPDRLIPFVVIYPEDEDAPEQLLKHLENGAKGVKLFAGHGAKHGKGPFHTMPLNDPRLEKIYDILEEREIPLLYHVNYNKYRDEFEAVLAGHPRMKVLCPHFCLSLKYHSRVRSLLKRYPNLWTDVSFGYIQFQAEGFRRISKKPKSIRKLIEDYPDRFIYGTDLVITAHAPKTIEWMEINNNSYRDMLERPEYTFYGLEGNGPLKGLALKREFLQGIYRDNAEAWLYGKPKDPAPAPAKKKAVQPANGTPGLLSPNKPVLVRPQVIPPPGQGVGSAGKLLQRKGGPARKAAPAKDKPSK